MPRMPHGAKVSPYRRPVRARRTKPCYRKQKPAPVRPVYKYSQQNELSSFANRTAAP